MHEPYAILGVSTNASDQEIKNAYRRLVKQYHPDKQSPEASHEQIALVNQAYDLLSDPERRAQYDRGFAQIFVEVKEDPVEAYKREFKRKRREGRNRNAKLNLRANKTFMTSCAGPTSPSQSSRRFGIFLLRIRNEVIGRCQPLILELLNVDNLYTFLNVQMGNSIPDVLQI